MFSRRSHFEMRFGVNCCSTPCHCPCPAGTIGHVAHGKSTVVKAISGVQTVRFKNELERNITIKLGYANAKIFKAADPRCPRWGERITHHSGWPHQSGILGSAYAGQTPEYPKHVACCAEQYCLSLLPRSG